MTKCRIYTGLKVADVAEYLKGYPAIYIVADRRVSAFAEALGNVPENLSCNGVTSSLPENNTAPKYEGRFLIDASEENKNMSGVLDICKWLMDKGASRSALLLAIGGGITTDMAGFAASIYKRGIRFAYIPTTFLSQVDAAIGGKTGVNLENFKNIIGVIRQPEFTYVTPEVLGTLPYRDFLSGAAELLKTFIIDNADDNYHKAVKVLSEIHDSPDHASAIAAHLSELEKLVGAAASVKAGIVERDELETGERRKLNLGHTFAHAIEHEARIARKDITHGEAVSMGVILAARFSSEYYGASRDMEATLTADFKACGLPVACPFAVGTLAAAMRNDKKAEGDRIHFVLIRAVGDVRIETLSISGLLGQ